MPSSDPFACKLPFVTERIGAVAIYCSDGRYNEQIDEFLHKRLELPRYDRLVIPGGAAALAGHFVAYREADALIDQLRFLVDSHNLQRVVLISHESCGFYLKRLHTSPRDLRAQQTRDLAAAKERIWSVSTRLVVETFHAALEGTRVVIEPVEPQAT
jgi:hypothetical protein